MASAEQLRRLIKFSLQDLGGQNGHHEFEHMCRAISTRRIASNIVPATGPVSAGGDQGRDFETFRTYLATGLNGTSGFLALASSDVLTFACTLQKDSLSTKIKEDAESICTQGTHVDAIYYFATGSLPVAARHRLKDEAERDYQVKLEILDGEAVAGFLADPDLYWIANEYLHLPLEMAPALPPEQAALPDWYLSSRTRWRSQTSEHFSSADFFEIRQAVRHATFEDEARPDLPEWLELLRAIISDARNQDDQQQARYELAVATLRGTNTLRPVEHIVRDFIRLAMTESGTGLLMDAAVLLTYCLGARTRGLTEITALEIRGWNQDLQSRVRTLLAEAPPTNRRAGLLAVLAHLAFDPVPADPEDVDQEGLHSPAEITRIVREARRDGTAMPVPKSLSMQLVDLPGGFDALIELIELLPDAHTFAIEQLCDWFDFLSPLLVDEPRYGQVRDALDAATDRVAGDDAVASRCRNRALALVEAGRLVQALNEFHAAKVNWFHGDTLHNSLQAMLLISYIYSALRLPLAGKQYALAAAFTAVATDDSDLHDLIPAGLFAASDCDYDASAWISATDLTRVAVLAQSHYMPDPWDEDEHAYLPRAWTHQAMRIHAAQQIRPQLLPQLRGVLEDTSLHLIVDPLLAGVDALEPRSEAEWAQMTDQQINGRPFDDAGPERRFHWAALGTRWHVRSPNDRTTVLAAERFGAAAQVLLADLSVHDPLLLPGDIHIQLRVRGQRDDADPCQEVPDNAASRWIVTLTAYDTTVDEDAMSLELLVVLTRILLTITLLPTDPFMALVEGSFKNGLTHKLAAGRPYDEIADLRPEESYTTAAAYDIPPVAADQPRDLSSADKLPPPTSPGPGYTLEDSTAACTGRYRNLPPMIRYTLPRLLEHARIRQLFAELRADGWLDWHLLNAAANIAANQRVYAAKLPLPPRNEVERKFIGRFMRMPEDANGPVVPLDLFTRKSMQDALDLSALHTLKNWGLEDHQTTPDFPAILTLLGQRYGYWTDDVPHEDLLGAISDAADEN